MMSEGGDERLSRSNDQPDGRVRLAVLIVNFRTPGLTVDCLRSLAPEVEEAGEVHVEVVDNGSGDGSTERIGEAIEREGWRRWAHLTALGRNYGFAGGNNRAYEAAPEADYVLLLNSDTLVHRGCLRHCLAVMEERPEVGAMSCAVLNTDGTPQNAVRHLPHPLRLLMRMSTLPYRLPNLLGWTDPEDEHWDRLREKREVGWIGGAFLLLRGAFLRRHGLLDEDFFFYGEDIELCHRVWKAGYRCYYDPGASITHLGGGSSDASRISAEKVDAHRWRARYLIQRKLYGRWAEWLIRAADIFEWSLRNLVYSMRGAGAQQRRRHAQQVLRVLMGRVS